MPEEGLGLCLKPGEVEVGTTLLQGDDEFGGVGAKLYGRDPMPGGKLGEKSSRVPKSSIVSGGQLDAPSVRQMRDASVPPGWANPFRSWAM